MEKLKLVEPIRNDIVPFIDYEPIKLEMKRIQEEVSRDALDQKRSFLVDNLKYVFYSLVVYGFFVIFAWAKYKA